MPSAPLSGHERLRRSARATARALVAFLAVALAPEIRGQNLRPEQRPGSIVGIVQTAPGVPATGATVAIVGTVLETLVLPDGTFRLDGVTAGVYDLVISGSLYRTTTIADVAVKPMQTVELTITLATYPQLSDLRVETPSRRAQPIYESSSAVTVVEASDAAFIGGHSIDRVLASTADVSLAGALASLRGSSGGPIGAGGRVGLFVDGIPLTAPDLGAPLFASIPLAAIEQVEIVKGAATTLYGPGVISGAINIVTPRPADRQRASVSAYTGVYTAPDGPKFWGARPQRFGGAEIMWTQRSRSVGVMLAGTMLADEGYRQFESQGRFDLFSRLDVFMDRGAELRVTGILAQHEHGPLAPWRSADSALFSSIADSVVPPATTSLRTLGVEYRGVDSKSLSFVLRGTLQGVSTYGEHTADPETEASASRYMAELHLTSFLNRRISFAYGGLAQFELGASPRYGDGITRTVGAYGRMEFTNLYDIVASIGTRVDLVLMPDVEEPNVLELSPSVGVAYHPIPSTSFRATIARGYRSPTIAERLLTTSAYGVAVVANPKLGPEQSWQGEVGAAHRVEIGGASITGDLGVYVHEYFAMIEPVYDVDIDQVTFVNAARARILGADLSVEATIDSGRFVAGIAIAATSARDVREGMPLRGRSPLGATISLAWRPQPLELLATYRYDARIPEIDDATRRIVVDAERRTATHLVDVAVGLDLRTFIELPLRLHLLARNVLQSRGFDGVGIPAPIRSLEAGIAVRL